MVNTRTDLWTKEEDNIIINNNDKTIRDLYLLLGGKRTTQAIQARVSKFRIEGKIEYKRRKREWPEKDLIKLEQLVKENKTNFQISNILGYTITDIANKIYSNKLNRRRNGAQIKWTNEMNSFVCDNILKGNTVEYIAEKLEIDPHKVLNKVRHLGIPAYKMMTEQKLNGKDKRDEAKQEYITLQEKHREFLEEIRRERALLAADRREVLKQKKILAKRGILI